MNKDRIWQMQEKPVAFDMFNSIFVDIFLAPRALTRLTIGFASEFLSHACCLITVCNLN